MFNKTELVIIDKICLSSNKKQMSCRLIDEIINNIDF